MQRGLEGRYVLERELGRGGMATVWLARDLKHDRPVALKLLNPAVSASLGTERFLREIHLAARLQHPHIVPVYDSGAAEQESGPERLWYSMPYVDGESLRDRLRREGALPAGEAVRIAAEAAQALAYAHAQGIVHRDIKPENVLLARDGSTLVADFGIARPLGGAGGPHLTSTGMIVGTPAYMSPEQAGGAEVLDQTSDVYSLGCVLYEMLTGEPPFSAPTPQALMIKHMTQPAPAIEARAGVPRPLARIVARALAKQPSERYASAAELAQVLRDAGARRDAPRGSRAAGLAMLGALALAAILLVARGSRLGVAGTAAGPGEAVASGFNRRLSQITFGQGMEEWPSWSPNGDQLAYVGEVDGFRQIFVRDRNTGGERQITTDRFDHIQPAWSPDGRHLVFVQSRAAGGKLEPNDLDGWYQENGEIWSVDLTTGVETRLVEDGFGPAWSPDGSTLAFDAQWAGPRRIWVADARGRNPRQITSDSSDAVVHVQPRWSPDGSRLVFRRIEKTTSDVVVVEVASQAMSRLTSDEAMDTDPAWSPGGSHIYFSSNRGGGVNVWRVPVSAAGAPSGPAEQLTTGAGSDVQVAVGGAGRLAFAVRGINADLWRLPVSRTTGRPSGGPEPVLATTRVESRGSWSPDGRHIAFNSDRQGEMNIWVRSLEDGTERRITAGSGGDYQPTWSPDGSRLAFFSARGRNTDIWEVGADGSGLARLTDDPSIDTNPFYSPDGRLIAFMSDRSGRSEVWVMSADGSGQRALTSVGVWGHFLRWTPDGLGIVFRAQRDREVRILRASVEDGALTRLPDVESGAHMSFSPDHSIVLDVRGHKTLWAYPVDGRPAYEVFEFPEPDVRIDYPAWSPDGRWVLFDRAAPLGGDLWLLEGLD